MGTKKENYTAEQTAELVEGYNAVSDQGQEARDHCVAQFAALFGKTPASIRAKLTSEGVYIAKSYKTKKGAKPESKALMVSDIARILGVSSEVVESLEKANKKALELVRGTLAKLPVE